MGRITVLRGAYSTFPLGRCFRCSCSRSSGMAA
jgi:hypothetical protein